MLMDVKNFIQIIVNEPIYLSIASILLLIIVYSILKKLFKILLFGLSLLVIYVVYLVITEQPLPGDIIIDKEEVFEKTKQVLDNIKDNLGNNEKESKDKTIK